MAKCIRCGKSTVVRGHVKLEDAAICTPCFKSIGFKLTDTAGAAVYRYEDIKNGKDQLGKAMAERRRKHLKWLEEHPEVVDFIDALDESLAEEPDEEDPDEIGEN